MANKTFEIKIESILGGHSPTTHFAKPDQFRSSVGIDPALPATDTAIWAGGSGASGLLRPVGMYNTASGLASAPLWMLRNPKDGNIYIYDYAGSVYSSAFGSPATGLTDLNDGGTAKGNGAAYYDNYIYFSRETTVARYGPLSGGTAGFTDDYWVGTLGKTALSSTTYPNDDQLGIQFPNHILHRHSDGRLYVADVVGNQGTIHFIKTTKTTVEGDTDAGSTYSALQFGYGLWPTAIASYGSSIVVALFEANYNNASTRAKIAFWDTTSPNPNQITWVEFPDSLVTAIRNIDGTLYFFSGYFQTYGVRITRYVGGNTFEEIAYLENANLVFPGAVEGEAGRLVFGTYSNDVFMKTVHGQGQGCVYSLGLQKASLGFGLFNIAGTTDTTLAYGVTSILRQASDNVLQFNSPYVGWGCGVPASGNVDSPVMLNNGTPSDYSKSPIAFWSQLYRVGRPFKITKIRIPLAQAVAANMTVVPKIYTDDGAGTTHTLTTINNTNYPNSERNIVIRPTNATGQHNFWLELNWTGSALCTVALPISIEYELLAD